MKATNKLILITSGFPYGREETFLETEILYLSKYFDGIDIISVNPTSMNKRSLPSNCKVHYLFHNESFLNKIIATLSIFNILVFKEIKIIKKIYKKKITSGIIATILMGLYRGKSLKKYIEINFDLTGKDYDTFIYSYWCDDSALGIALLQKKYPKITTLARAHGWDLYFEVSSINYLPFRHFIVNTLHAIFPISEKGKKYCKDMWKINDINRLKISRLGAVNQVPVNFNPKNILISCSNIIPLKRIDLIIHSLSLIKDLNINWYHFGDGSEKDRVKKLAESILGKNINFKLMGFIPNVDLLKWYELTNPNLFINVSSSEGIPVSIMEAMSFGVPVIATDVGGNSEIVNNENGYLIAANPTPQEIAEKIHAFFSMPTDLKIIKQKSAYNTWEKVYNAEINYTIFSDEILKLHQQNGKKLLFN